MRMLGIRLVLSHIANCRMLGRAGISRVFALARISRRRFHDANAEAGQRPQAIVPTAQQLPCAGKSRCTNP